MSVRASVTHAPSHRFRVVVVLVALLALVSLTGLLRAPVDSLLSWSEEVLRGHRVLGMLLFTSLAVASPLLALFSSALLVPAALAAWGATTTFVLLWGGWIGGGMTAYAVARWLGRPVVHRLVSARKLAWYEERVRRDVRWSMLLLLQLALPSELPGYLAGALRVRFRMYVAALALGELPYAIGTVLLGGAYLQRDALVLGAVLTAGLVLLAVASRALHAKLSPTRAGDLFDAPLPRRYIADA